MSRSKNVLQFLYISAHGRIPCNLVSKYQVHLAIHMKLHHCSYISMSFLQHILFGNVKMGVSCVDLTFCSPVAYLPHLRICRPIFFKAFHSKTSGVGLNFECRCQANFCLNVACRTKKWANVACRNKAFMGPRN